MIKVVSALLRRLFSRLWTSEPATLRAMMTPGASELMTSETLGEWRLPQHSHM